MSKNNRYDIIVSDWLNNNSGGYQMCYLIDLYGNNVISESEIDMMYSFADQHLESVVLCNLLNEEHQHHLDQIQYWLQTNV